MPVKKTDSKNIKRLGLVESMVKRGQHTLPKIILILYHHHLFFFLFEGLLFQTTPNIYELDWAWASKQSPIYVHLIVQNNSQRDNND